MTTDAQKTANRVAARRRAAKARGENPDLVDGALRSPARLRASLGKVPILEGALCVNFPDLHFSENSYDQADAEEMCGLCPARETCLLGATVRGEVFGIWGGVQFDPRFRKIAVAS